MNNQATLARLEEKVHRLENANSGLRKTVAQLRAAYHELQAAFLYTMHNVVMAAEFRFDERENGLSRIPRYVGLIAKHLGMSDDEIKTIHDASATYDVGKIAIPVDILLKPDRLTDEEFDIVKTHTIIGGNLLGNNSDDKIFTMARQVALSHHEWWDGSGYPIGLAREKIPIAARIVSLVDVFDALVSKRPHREAYPVHVACEMIRAQRNRQFDPVMVDAFERCIDQILNIRNERAI